MRLPAARNLKRVQGPFDLVVPEQAAGGGPCSTADCTLPGGTDLPSKRTTREISSSVQGSLQGAPRERIPRIVKLKTSGGQG